MDKNRSGLIVSVATAIALLTYGCAPLAVAQPVPKGAEFSDGRYETIATLYGPEHGLGQFGNQFAMSWRLSSNVFKNSGKVIHGVTFHNLYAAQHWRRWRAASTEHAQSIQTDAISRKVIDCRAGACSFSEVMLLYVPAAMLQNAEKQGLRMRVTSESGESAYLDLSPQEVAAHMVGVSLLQEKYPPR